MLIARGTEEASATPAARPFGTRLAASLADLLRWCLSDGYQYGPSYVTSNRCGVFTASLLQFIPIAQNGPLSYEGDESKVR